MMKKNTTFILLFTLILLTVTFSSFSFAKKQFPSPQGYVTDFAGILSEQDKVSVSSFLKQIERKTTAEVSVAIVKTIKPYGLERYTVKLFQEWGIGKRGKDNGVLLLISYKERKVRIEVGYGLEGALPDGLCGEIIRKGVVPFFKKGEYSQGIWIGVIQIGKAIAKEYNVSLELGNKRKNLVLYKAKRKKPILSSIFYLLFFLALIGLRSGILPYLFLGSMYSHRRSYWSSGGSFGGFSGSSFGGFGGGLSGGGGASGSW